MTRRLAPAVRSASSDAGETLIELVVAIAVLGIAVVALVSGLGTAILTSGLHRTAAVQSTAIRDYAEWLEQTTYVSCATPATYAPLSGSGFTTPAGSSIVVSYWTSTGYTSTCGTDSGLQMVTITLPGADDTRVRTETVSLIKRRPCSDLSC